MARKKTVGKAGAERFSGPSAPNETITEDTPLAEFKVAHGALFDATGKKCRKGDTALLTENLANYLAKRGMIEVEIVFDAKTTKSFSPSSIPKVAPEQGGDDPQEAEDGAAADGGGAEPSSGSDPAPSDATEGNDGVSGRRRRRKPVT